MQIGLLRKVERGLIPAQKRQEQAPALRNPLKYHKEAT